MTRDRVIVAGAGPVGLTVALALAQAGVPVSLFEKRPTLNTASKASTFHPPTIEILDRLGVASVLLSEGQRVERIQYRTPDGGPFAEFALALLAPQTRFPFRVHLEQSRITPLMVAALARFPQAEIRFGAAVVDVDQTPDRVRATIEGSDGRTQVDAAFLIGADGARSQVRESLGIDFDGEAYPHKILRVMTDADLCVPLPGLAPISYVHRAEKSISFLKMPDCWRIILRVPADVAEETALRDDWILDRLREVFPDWTSPPNIVGRDVYGASKRIAGRYHQGRAVLIGDAAHVTNTRGGMNMNAGIHDAYVIADAIVEALNNGDPAGVHRVADARRRVATDLLIPRTDRSVAGGAAWLDHVAQMARNPAAATAYLGTTAMLDMVDLPQKVPA